MRDDIYTIYILLSDICTHKRDLDLDPTMPIIELVRDICIYYKVFQFHVPRSITF